LTAFSLEPTDAQYYAIENCFHSLPSGVQPAPPPSVDLQLFIALSEVLCQLRQQSLDPRFGWSGNVKLAAARRLEEAGRTFSGSEKQPDELEGAGSSRRAEINMHRGTSSTTHAGGLTLDDIQQVLSCPGVNEVVTSSSTSSTGGAGGTNDAAIDERALREITAYLQSEVGSTKSLHDSLLPSRPAEVGTTAAAVPPVSQYQAQDSNFVVRLMPQVAPVNAEQSERSREVAASSGDVSGTILVTESNLPYLQQFLPNLQTVMQSVQSLVRAAPPQQQPPSGDVHVNGLPNCGPRLATPVAARSQPVFVTTPGTVTDGLAKDLPEGGSLKKRKRPSQAGSVKSEHSAVIGKTEGTAGIVTTPIKSSEASKHCEPDSASSVGEGGFVCDLCNRSFSKRLGLSVHIQRAHGHRRKSESADVPPDTGSKVPGMASVTCSDDAAVKNCFVKMARLGDEGPVGALATTGSKAVDSAGHSACMCDSCGDIVSGLEAHALVCVGRRSPAKVQNQNGTPSEVKTEQVALSSGGVNPGAVIEMLQLAEHFLRQHVPSVSSSAESTQHSSAMSNVEHTLHIPSPPPYRETSDLRTTPYVASTPSGSSSLPVLNAETLKTTSEDQAQAGLNGSGGGRPPGKEIIYEGTRMREFVEYQCDACLLTFVTSASANTHVADHHNSASVSAYRVYACTSCALRYRDPRIMRHHVVYLCAGGGQQPNEQQTSNQQRLHVCALCPKTFVSSEYLELHIRVRHGSTSQSGQGSSQCVLPAPPGITSIPSLEQLTTNCRRHPETGSAQPVLQTSVLPGAQMLGHSADIKTDSLSEQFSSPADRSISSVKHHSPETPDSIASDVKVIRTNAADHKMDNSVCGKTSAEAGGKSRSRPKGIVYKNVFMQCEGTYFCSECKADLTGREAKRRHRQLPCGDPKTASYSRRYTYLCPYCSERFPSQKVCRQHQIDKCLPQIGVPTAELGIGEHRCPLCPKVCFGYAALKGHMSQVHLSKEKTNRVTVSEQDLNFMPSEDVGSTEPEFNGGISPPDVVNQSGIGLEPSSTLIDQSATSPVLSAVCDGGNNLRNHDGSMDNGDEKPDTSKLNLRLMVPLTYEVGENVQIRDGGSQQSGVEDGSRPKRNRKSRSSEFFVMMFRNYPIMAKGVSMCRSCGAQLEPNDTAEMHAPACTGTAPVEVRRSTLFRCTHCSATFWRAKDCRVHQIESCLPAHGVDVGRLTEPSVACPMCNVRSYNRSGLMSHMKFRHELDTDGVRQVMDRCGIKKSIPPPSTTTPDDVAVPVAGSNEPLLFDDGSHSFDGVPSHCIPACDDDISSSVSKADTSFRCSSSTPDDLVHCVANSSIGNDLLSVSNGETVADLDDGAAWQTAIV
jgi:uncharacterized protein with PIN domain